MANLLKTQANSDYPIQNAIGEGESLKGESTMQHQQQNETHMPIDEALAEQWGMFSYTPEQEAARTIKTEGYSSLIGYRLFKATLEPLGLRPDGVLWGRDNREMFLGALEGHENADEIAKILSDDPEYSNESSNGYVATHWDGKTQMTDSEREHDLIDDDREGIRYGMGLGGADVAIKADNGWALGEMAHNYYVYGLTTWKHGFFIPSSFEKATRRAVKARRYFGIDSEALTQKGTIRKRKAETTPRRPRVARRKKALAFEAKHKNRK